MKKIQNETEAPDCSSQTCCSLQAGKCSFGHVFLYIGQHCEYRSIWSGSKDNVQELREWVNNQKDQISNKFRIMTDEIFCTWAYLLDGTMPYPECKQAGFK